MRRLLTGMALVVVPVLAGCGGSSSGGTSTPSTIPSTTTSSNTTPSSAGGNGAILDTAAGYDGTFNGSWKNTTFGSTGAASAVVTTNKAAKTTSINLTLGGNVFGSGVQPELITGQLTDAGFAFAGHSTIFGDVAMTITPDGTLSLSATNTSPRVTKFVAAGKVTSTSFTLNYIASLSTGPARGTITLSK